MTVNGFLTTRSLPSPLRESISSTILLARAHHVILGRFARLDNLYYNRGDVVSRIAVEKLGFIPDSNETMDNAPLTYKYVKKSYQLNRMSGHVMPSTKLLETSVESTVNQVEALLEISAQETDENQLIKMLLKDGKKYSCTLGTTTTKVGNLTELSPEDLNVLHSQMDYAQINPTNPEPMFASPFWGSKGRAQDSMALVIPADYAPSFRKMVRNNVAVAVEQYSRIEDYRDPNELGILEQFKIYKSSLMRGSITSDGKKVYEGIVLGGDTFVKVNGLARAENVYQSRSVASKEGSFCAVGKAFYVGSCILRNEGVYTIKFTDFTKA
ncbi:MAG: hypothetical protein ACRCX2_12065 [Paraclostridium sp.]